jgi:hypothetical protein
MDGISADRFSGMLAGQRWIVLQDTGDWFLNGEDYVLPFIAILRVTSLVISEG